MIHVRAVGLAHALAHCCSSLLAVGNYVQLRSLGTYTEVLDRILKCRMQILGPPVALIYLG